MNILILGGTGVIGKSLVELYNNMGVNVCVTSRQPHENFGTIRYVLGNAMEDIFIKKICSERVWDAIVDLMSYKTEAFERRVKILLNSTKQYVFISSARVYADKEHPIKETSPRLLEVSDDLEFLATDEYSLTKARQEDILLKSERKNYTIVRPCITYGPHRLQLGVLEKEEWLYRVLHGRSIAFPQEILNSVTTMTIGSDICSALYKIIGNPSAIGTCFHLTSDHHRTWFELLCIYKTSLKKMCNIDLKLKIVPLKYFLKCRNKDLKYQVIYDRVYNRDYDTSKERQFVDVDRFIAPEEGLDLCLNEFFKDKKFKNINWKLEAYKDKLTHEKTPLKEIKGFKNKIIYLIERYVKRM